MRIIHFVLLTILLSIAPVYAEEQQQVYYNNTAWEVLPGPSSPVIYTPSEAPTSAPVVQPQRQKTISEMVAEAEQIASTKFGLTPQVQTVMKSIKKVESGNDPWALCVNTGSGKFYSVRPRNYYEAVYYLEHIKTDNIDIGPWQVNYLSWGKPYGYTKTDLLNPYISSMLAAYILSSEIAAHGPTWDAVGNYHSHTMWRKVQYVKSVKSELRKEGYQVDR